MLRIYARTRRTTRPRTGAIPSGHIPLCGHLDPESHREKVRADVLRLWWLNLQAHPEVSVDLAEGSRTVKGRAAKGEERLRLWDRWREIDKNLDDFAARRSGETAVVILEPLPDPNG